MCQRCEEFRQRFNRHMTVIQDQLAAEQAQSGLNALEALANGETPTVAQPGEVVGVPIMTGRLGDDQMAIVTNDEGFALIRGLLEANGRMFRND